VVGWLGWGVVGAVVDSGADEVAEEGVGVQGL